jgi:phospholipid transport system transporter-binding protein
VIRCKSDVLYVDGPVTLHTVPGLMDEAAEHMSHVRSIDFSGATDIDSSAVALALEWQRQAQARGAALELRSFPAAMQNLARLYGVSELFEPAAR